MGTFKPEYHSGTRIEHVRPMFLSSWKPILASLTSCFEDFYDRETLAPVLEGFQWVASWFAPFFLIGPHPFSLLSQHDNLGAPSNFVVSSILLLKRKLSLNHWPSLDSLPALTPWSLKICGPLILSCMLLARIPTRSMRHGFILWDVFRGLLVSCLLLFIIIYYYFFYY